MGHCVSCMDRAADSDQQTVFPLKSEDGAPEEKGHANDLNCHTPRLVQQKEAASAAHNSDPELQATINAIMNASKSRCDMSPVAGFSDSALQDQINAIVGAHASSLKQQRDLASPSPSP